MGVTSLSSFPSSSSTSYFTARTSSLSTSPAGQWKYDIFLNFRGEDTRNNFVDHLYNVLKDRGIYTFRDDQKLERGKFIKEELMEAIEESKFAIVVLSENYASSTWCLDELVKIIVCRKYMGMTVLPVFHYVNPSDVRKQRGAFAKPFVEYEKKGNKERVKKWRDALRQVGNLRGWHLNNYR